MIFMLRKYYNTHNLLRKYIEGLELYFKYERRGQTEGLRKALSCHCKKKS